MSIINSCNLRCQGCWVDVAAKQQTISPDAFDKLRAATLANSNPCSLIYFRNHWRAFWCANTFYFNNCSAPSVIFLYF